MPYCFLSLSCSIVRHTLLSILVGSFFQLLPPVTPLQAPKWHTLLSIPAGRMLPDPSLPQARGMLPDPVQPRTSPRLATTSPSAADFELLDLDLSDLPDLPEQVRNNPGGDGFVGRRPTRRVQPPPSPPSQRRPPGSSPPYACAELEEMELGRPSLDPLTSPDDKCGSAALCPHYLRPHTSTSSDEGGPPAQRSSGSSLDGGPPSLCPSSSSDEGGLSALRPHSLRPHCSAQRSSGTSSSDGGPPSLCPSSSSDGGGSASGEAGSFGEDGPSGEAAGSSGVDEQLASALVDRVLADLQVKGRACILCDPPP